MIAIIISLICLTGLLIFLLALLYYKVDATVDGSMIVADNIFALHNRKAEPREWYALWFYLRVRKTFNIRRS